MDPLPEGLRRLYSPVGCLLILDPIFERMNASFLSIDTLRNRYLSGELTPELLIREIRRRIESVRNSGIWIHVLNDRELEPYLDRLKDRSPEDLPLYGIPFAIKDNIDLAGIPTTAACPDYSYTPERSAVVVEKLIEAGAIPIGKTNLDQFATGLVGVRSPYNPPRNPLAADRVPGGSSSGSAVAVREGLVTFSLGTDTAGSGRVPAAFNGIVGLKPSRGRLSARGMLPACRSLDCVSIFASCLEDCRKVLYLTEGYDAMDPFSRPLINRSGSGRPRIGIPATKDLMFFGDAGFGDAWKAYVHILGTAGWRIEEVDFSCFLEAGRLLYEGPWVAERYAAIREFIEAHPQSLYSVTRKIIEGGNKPPGYAVFAAQYKLMELKRKTEKVWERVDVLVTPTAGGFPTLADLESDSLGPNSQLGYYTHFMNLLDLSAVALPAGETASGLPFGVSWIAPRDRDQWLFDVCQTGPQVVAKPGDTLSLILFGAHMHGLALNVQVKDLGGQFVGGVATAPFYRMFHLPDPPPERPGLLRVEKGGESVPGEEWAFPVESVGALLQKIRQPLGLSEIVLTDGRKRHGFICEHAATCDAKDITSFRGWRNFISASR